MLRELLFSKFHHRVTLRCFLLNVFSLLSSRKNSAKRADLFLTTVSRFHYKRESFPSVILSATNIIVSGKNINSVELKSRRRTPHEVRCRSKVHVVGVEIHYPGRLKRASLTEGKALVEKRKEMREILGEEKERRQPVLTGCFEQLIQPLWRNNRLAKCSPAAACCYTPSAEANSLQRRPQTTKVPRRKTNETVNRRAQREIESGI